MPFLNNMTEVSFFSPYSWFSSFVYISFVGERCVLMAVWLVNRTTQKWFFFTVQYIDGLVQRWRRRSLLAVRSRKPKCQTGRVLAALVACRRSRVRATHMPLLRLQRWQVGMLECDGLVLQVLIICCMIHAVWCVIVCIHSSNLLKSRCMTSSS